MKLATLVGSLVALALVAPVFAQGEPAAATKSPEAIEILKKVDATTKAVTSVRYHATVVPTGAAANFGAAAEGDVAMTGWTGAGPEKFFATVATKRGEESVSLTAGGNGESFFVMDHGKKKAYEDMDPGVMGSYRGAIFGLAMFEFVHPTPFEDELNAPKVEMQGSESVAGEDCHKIYVDYGPNRGRSTWYFSKKDNLPRRRIQHITDREGAEGAIDRTVTKLEIDPTLDAAVFALKLPEGYERIEDFAP